MTDSDAKTKWCSYVQIISIGKEEYISNRGIINDTCNCITKDCMHWVVDHPRCEREDHSGALEMMNNFAYDTKRIVKREGPHGCMGILYLEETGHCGRSKLNE